ncbi:MAG: hypothetical protein ACXWB9_04600, partial [Flavisolibacter sp.]
MSYAYKLDKSFEEFQPEVLAMIQTGKFAPNDFAIVYSKNKPQSKPIHFICRYDIYPDLQNESRLTQKQ